MALQTGYVLGVASLTYSDGRGSSERRDLSAGAS
jgi:hypothetical protein